MSTRNDYPEQVKRDAYRHYNMRELEQAIANARDGLRIAKENDSWAEAIAWYAQDLVVLMDAVEARRRKIGSPVRIR